MPNTPAAREDKSTLLQENTWHRDYRAKLCRLRAPKIRDSDYTYLLNSSPNEIRALGKEVRTKHSGVKNAVIRYLLLKEQAVISCGGAEWNKFFRGRFQNLWTSAAKISTQVRLATSD